MQEKPTAQPHTPPPATQTLPTVLVVDDTHENLRLLSDILKRQGYRVRLAPGGQVALDSVRANPPDLILLDIRMPNLDGYAVCEHLKADPRSRDIPVIFISALNDVFDKVHAFKLGAVDYVTKPFQIEEVVVRVQTQLAIQQTNRLLKAANEQLTASIDELERRNLEMNLLTRMTSALQLSQSLDEACEVSLPYMQQLFPEGGVFYLLNPGNNQMDRAITWNTPDLDAATLDVRACPISGSQRRRLMKDALDVDECPCTLAQHAQLPMLCLPLRSRSQMVGMMHLRCGPQEAKQRDHWERLALMVADHCALTLFNLRLWSRLHEQAIRDPLTGLYNRRFLAESLEREMVLAQRHQRPLGIVLLDIDHFKLFNDTYGHEGGDDVLRALGSLMRSTVRKSDIPCRLGGEELLVVLPEASLEDTQQRAEELRLAVRHMRVESGTITLPTVTVSIGVASYPQHGSSPDEIIAAADQALYRAKASGRDRVMLATVAQAA